MGETLGKLELEITIIKSDLSLIGRIESSVQTMARVTLVLTSLTLVLGKAAVITPSSGNSCQNSAVLKNDQGHYGFLNTSLQNCENEKFDQETIQNQSKKLCQLKDFYLGMLCNNPAAKVVQASSSDPCLVLPTHSQDALLQKANIQDKSQETLLGNFAHTTTEAGNNFCQDLCRIPQNSSGTNEVRYHPGCEDLRRALASLYPKATSGQSPQVISGPGTMVSPASKLPVQGASPVANQSVNQAAPETPIAGSEQKPAGSKAIQSSVKKNLDPASKNETMKSGEDQKNPATSPLEKTKTDDAGELAKEPEDSQNNVPPKASDSDKQYNDFDNEPSNAQETQENISESHETNKKVVDKMPVNPAPSEDTPSYFLTYFFALTIICIAGYLIFHNKNKLMGLCLEGRRPRTGRRQRRDSSSSTRYRKLDNNLEEAMGPNSSTSFSQVVY